MVSNQKTIFAYDDFSSAHPVPYSLIRTGRRVDPAKISSRQSASGFSPALYVFWPDLGFSCP